MSDQVDKLASLMRDHPRLVALTGAGVSAGSGIPTYRNDRGEWQRGEPIQHTDFMQNPAMRRRYWARSMLGWPIVAESRPNAAHRALVELERLGHVPLLVTQNVDRLHQRAGHRVVIDLHGRLDRVRCLECGADRTRDDLQTELQALNPGYADRFARVRPDGDAEVADRMVEQFRVPDCALCDGVLMPDVVFFGGGVPKDRVERIGRAIEQNDALLVVGSSLKVFSGFRFCRLARQLGKPLFIINRGHTRADELATLKLRADCESALARLASSLGAASARVLKDKARWSPDP